MKKNKFLKQTLLLLVAFASMTLMGINWHLAIAAWLCPVFILLYLRNTRIPGFLIFFVVAIVAGIISRTCFAMVDLFIVHFANGLFFALSFCLPFLIDRLIYKKEKGFYSTLIFPSAVVLIEYLVGLLMGTWGTTAHTQYHFNAFVQLSSVTGILGISFLVAWFGAILNWLFESKLDIDKIKKAVLIYGSVFFMVVLYGQIRIIFFPFETNTVRVSAISGDLDLFKLVAENFESMQYSTKDSTKIEIPESFYSSDEMINSQINKTLKAVNEHAKIIVWNEISLVLKNQQADSLKQKIRNIADSSKVYILIAYLEQNAAREAKPFDNKSVLIKPDGKIGWEYNKSFLHPDSEAPIINPGDGKIPFIDSKYGRLGTVICYDMEFSDFIKQAGKQSIDIMLVPSYDWAEITPFHSQMASFEAVANGFSILRPNGNGHSTAYDYQGNLIAQLNTFTSREKIMYADLPVKSVETLYAVIGNTIVYLSIGLLIFSIAIRIFRTKQGNNKNS